MNTTLSFSAPEGDEVCAANYVADFTIALHRYARRRTKCACSIDAFLCF